MCVGELGVGNLVNLGQEACSYLIEILLHIPFCGAQLTRLVLGGVGGKPLYSGKYSVPSQAPMPSFPSLQFPGQKENVND